MATRHLALADRHIAEGWRRIERQRETVRKLRSDGHDLATAKALLAEFELTQSLHIKDRERILDELAGD